MGCPGGGALETDLLALPEGHLTRQHRFTVRLAVPGAFSPREGRLLDRCAPVAREAGGCQGRVGLRPSRP